MARIQYIIESTWLASWTVAAIVQFQCGGKPWSNPILLALFGVILLSFFVFWMVKKMGVWVRTKEAGPTVADRVQLFAIFILTNLALYYAQFKLISVVCAISYLIYHVIRTYRANFLTKP